jgi:hypothetical protein
MVTSEVSNTVSMYSVSERSRDRDWDRDRDWWDGGSWGRDRDSWGRIRGIMATDEDWHHIAVAASARKVMEAGGRVCLGGHGQMQGLGPHWELRAFVQGGMTPLQALRVGTLYPAQTLGLDQDLGSIEPGKLADFVVLEKNPLEKIEHSTSVTLVVKNGRAYTPDELARKRVE